MYPRSLTVALKVPLEGSTCLHLCISLEVRGTFDSIKFRSIRQGPYVPRFQDLRRNWKHREAGVEARRLLSIAATKNNGIACLEPGYVFVGAMLERSRADWAVFVGPLSDAVPLVRSSTDTQ